MARQITYDILADSTKFESGMKSAASAAKVQGDKIEDAAKKADRMQSALDGAGGAADASESKFMGTADLLDGLGGAFGLPTEGATNMMRSFGDLSGGFATLQPLIGGVAGVLKSGLGGALSFIAAHPVIITIALLTAAFVLLWKHSETFRDIVTGVFETVGNVIGGVWNWVKDNWPLLLAILTGPIGIAVGLIITHWDTIKNAFTAVKDWIADRIGDIVGFITGIPGRIAGVAATMWDGIKNAFTGVKTWIDERIVDIVGFFTGMPGRISGVVGGMFDGLKNAFRGAINWIIEAWNGLEFKIPGFKIGPVGFDGFTLGMPDIPRLQHGGDAIAGRMHLVGEAGPELFVPGRTGTVVPNGAMGRGYTINVASLDPATAAELVVRAVDEYEARNGARYARAG